MAEEGRLAPRERDPGGLPDLNEGSAVVKQFLPDVPAKAPTVGEAGEGYPVTAAGTVPDEAPWSSVSASEAQGVQIGDNNTQYNYYGSSSGELGEAKQVFLESLKSRQGFIDQFLAQALKQAETTYRLSVVFLVAGALVTLVAAVMGLVGSLEDTGRVIALLSVVVGLTVGASGASFAVRADRARKHLADQARRMHDELLDERRYTEAADLIAGIRDFNTNDQARVALALRILGGQTPDGS
jgi:hypothetical protein